MNEIVYHYCSVDAFFNIIKNASIWLSDIAKSNDNPQEYVQAIIADNIKKLEYKGVGHVAYELSGNYRMQFPFLKNPGFEEENEWRAVVCSGIRDSNIPSSDNILFSKVKYRTADNKLIPYIEMNFEKVKQSIIKEILIGPKSEAEVEDIVNFLNFCGYYDGMEGGYNAREPVDIKKSETTYR